jgi:hypothetical protein
VRSAVLHHVAMIISTVTEIVIWMPAVIVGDERQRHVADLRLTRAWLSCRLVMPMTSIPQAR